MSILPMQAVFASIHSANFNDLDNFSRTGVTQAGYTVNWLTQTGVAADKAYAEQAYPLAGRLWLSMATQGDEAAAYMLGMLYDQGLGMEQNVQRAVYWYRRAAQAGHIHAQHNLAAAYANGEGVELNMEEALKWWQHAALRGNRDSQYNLGIIYATGSRGVNRNIELAKYWWRKSARAGDAQAQFNLGSLYANADGGVRSYCEAARWWEESAKNGIQQAYRALQIIQARRDYLACW